MRTLKKALSLVLVLAMVFALAVPGFAANTTKKASDFKDYSKVTNKEAVDVLTAIGVINGNADGTFAPEGNFTRAEAATLISYLTLGKTVADALPTSATKFSDVPATHWAAKYVQYCADAGIVNGVGNGKFDPDAKLTANQWALMLLGALGYKASNEGIGGTGWELATTRLAMKAGIASASDLTGTFNRDVAAKMAFKTLTADVVEYSSNGTNITIGDATISTGASKAEKIVIASEGAANYAGSTTGAAGLGYQQFCEAHFDKLKLGTAAPDAFGRTANTWKNGTATIGTYAQTATATFNAKTSAANVASALSGLTVVNGNNTYSVNNITTVASATITMDSSNLTVSNETIAKAIADETENGKLVEVYATDAGVISKIVTITYSVGTISNKTTNKTATTYTISGGANAGNYRDFVDANTADEVVLNGNFAKGDVVTYVVAGGKAYIYPTTSFTGAQSAFNTTNNTITVGGTVYTVATGVVKAATPANVVIGDFGNNSATATYYVDQYGFVVKTTAAAASTNYAHIVAANSTLTTTIDGSTPAIEVRAVLSDGTVGVYKVALTKDSAGAYTITKLGTSVPTTDAAAVKGVADALVDKNYGYTLSETTITLEGLTAATSANFTTGAVYEVGSLSGLGTGVTSATASSISKTVLVNAATKYVVYDSDKKTATVYTGNSGLPANTTGLSGDAIVTANGTGTATASVIFVTSGTVGTATVQDYVYVDHTKYATILDGTETKFVYTGTKADGSTIDLTATSTLTADGLYTYTEKKTVAAANLLCTTTNTTITKVLYVYDATLTVSGTMVEAGGTYYNITDDTQIVYINSELSEVNDNGGYVVLAANNGQATKNVAAIFVTVN